MDHELPDHPGLARNTDPATSHAAAATLDATEMEELVLAAIRRFPNGCISDQIVETTGRSWNTVTPRLKPLRKKKLVELTGETRRGKAGRQQQVYICAKILHAQHQPELFA